MTVGGKENAASGAIVLTLQVTQRRDLWSLKRNDAGESQRMWQPALL